MEGSKKKSAKSPARKGRIKKALKDLGVLDKSDDVVVNENADELANAEEETAAKVEKIEKKSAPAKQEVALASEDKPAEEPARESRVVEFVETPVEPEPVVETKSEGDAKMSEEEVKVEVVEEAPVAAPEPAAEAPQKKSVIANPDRQLVNMVKGRSFTGPNDKLPTYLL